MRPVIRLLASLRRPARAAGFALGVMLMGLCAVSAPANARDHFSFGFGIGPAIGAWGPPVYYAPPPVYYAPPPAVYYPPPAPAYYDQGQNDNSGFDTSNCQPYHSTAVIGGVSRPISGTACRQPDGSWRMMN